MKQKETESYILFSFFSGPVICTCRCGQCGHTNSFVFILPSLLSFNPFSTHS